MSAQPKPALLTEEEYLAIERAAPFRSMYIDGEMYAVSEMNGMAGASEPHGTIVSNFVISLGTQFKGRPCKVYSTDFRVQAVDSAFYAYPDVVALCGPPKLRDGRKDTLTNPQLIVEVLSPGTAYMDRREKFGCYCQIPSFCDYLLVTQNAYLVEHRHRESGRPDDWAVVRYDSLDDSISLPALRATLTLRDIYDKVEFDDEPRLFTGEDSEGLREPSGLA